MTVREVMSENVIVAGLDESMETLMAIMTENRIRHIPIIDQGRLAGIVSIGDAVKAQLTVHEVQISYLKDYIEGKYPA
jgi:CBS domain-containing protein